MNGRFKGRLAGVIVLTALVGALLGAIAGYAYVEAQRAMKRSEARALAYSHAQRLAQRLQEALGPAYMLASLVQQGDGKLDNFEAVAVDLMAQFPMARAVELAPRGVVTKVFPLPGNESIIGHDLLQDRNRNREAHLAVARKQLTLAGPFELLQGGLGAVGRYPIFRYHRDGHQDFWGFSIVLIRVPELLSAAGFLQFRSEGYSYEICKVQVDEGGCTVFSRQGVEPLDDPIAADVDVPNGKWILSVAPDRGWIPAFDWIILALTALGVGILLGTLQYVLLTRLPAKS